MGCHIKKHTPNLRTGSTFALTFHHPYKYLNYTGKKRPSWGLLDMTFDLDSNYLVFTYKVTKNVFWINVKVHLSVVYVSFPLPAVLKTSPTQFQVEKKKPTRGCSAPFWHLAAHQYSQPFTFPLHLCLNDSHFVLLSAVLLCDSQALLNATVYSRRRRGSEPGSSCYHPRLKWKSIQTGKQTRAGTGQWALIHTPTSRSTQASRHRNIIGIWSALYKHIKISVLLTVSCGMVCVGECVSLCPLP